MAASGEDQPKGWHPPDERNLVDRGSGRGATTGGGEPSGAGATGAEVGDRLLPNGDLASTREGEPRSEHSPIGWGEEGEHYPPAVAPTAEEADRKGDPDR